MNISEAPQPHRMFLNTLSRANFNKIFVDLRGLLKCGFFENICEANKISICIDF